MICKISIIKLMIYKFFVAYSFLQKTKQTIEKIINNGSNIINKIALQTYKTKELKYPIIYSNSKTNGNIFTNILILLNFISIIN